MCKLIQSQAWPYILCESICLFALILTIKAYVDVKSNIIKQFLLMCGQFSEIWEWKTDIIELVVPIFSSSSFS